MAGFGSGDNDVKIKVTLDAADAVKQAERAQKEVTALGAAAEKAGKGVQKLERDVGGFGTSTAKSAKDVQKFEKEMEALAQATAKAAKFDRFPELSKQIKLAFDQKNVLGAEKFADRLFSIGEAANKLKIPLAEVTQRLADFGKGQIADGINQANNGITKFQGGLIAASAAINLVSSGLGSIKQLASSVGDTLARAGKFEGVENAFRTLQSSAGGSSVGTLNALRKATSGLVDDLTLMQKANQAVLLGLPTKGFDQMAAAAVKLGRAMGIDAAAAIDSLTIGVGRQSKLVLDNLGVIVDAETAYKNYAAANDILGRELTDVEKKMAFTEEAFRKITTAADNTADVTETAATGFQRFSAALENTQSKFDQAFNNSQTLKTGVENLGNAIAASPAPEGFAKITAAATGMAAGVGAALLNATNDILRFNTRSSEIAQGLQALQAEAVANSPLGKLASGIGSGVGSLLTSLKEKAAGAFAAGTTQLQDILKTPKELSKFTDEFAAKELGVDKFLGFKPEEVAKVRGELEKLFASQKAGTITAEAAAKQYKAYASTVVVGSKRLEDFEKISKRAFDAVEKKTRAAAKETKGLVNEQKRLADAYEDSRRGLDAVLGKAGTNGLGAGVAQSISDVLRGAGDIDRQLKALQDKILSGVLDPSQVREKAREFQSVLKDALQDAGKTVTIPDQVAKGTTVEQLFGASPEDLKKLTKNVEDTAAKFQDFPSLLGQQAGEGLGALLGFDAAAVGPVADSIAGTLNAALNAVATNGELDTEGIARGVGATIGAVIGGIYGGAEGAAGGAAIGNFAGGLVIALKDAFDSDTAGTQGRKAADAYFADIFDADRLSVVVGGQVQRIRDLVFKGATPFGGNSDFADGSFGNLFASLPQQAQQGFAGVGAAFEQLLGVSEDISGQLAAVLTNNVGGSLENLQVLVQSTGKSFEELGDAIFQSFFNGNLSLEELLGNLKGLEDIFTVGIPGQVGAVQEAADNFNAALADGKGSRILLDSLRDIAAEAKEVGKGLPAVVDSLVQTFGLGAASVAQIFEAMKLSGINSIEELINASNAQLATFAGNLQLILEGKNPTFTTPNNPTENYTPPTNFTAGSYNTESTKSSGGANKAANEAKRKEEDRKRGLRALAAEVYRVFTASKEYLAVTEQVTAGTLGAKKAQEQLEQIYKDSKRAVEALNTAQNKYDKAAEKGAKPGVLAKLADEVKKLQTAVDGLKKTSVDLSFLKGFQDNLNLLGLAATTAGTSVEDAKQKIINLYRAGKLSAEDANRELKKTEDIFAAGIPGAVGAVEEAFKNFREAGKNGGAFGIDALKDVFAEAKELFVQRQSPARLNDFQTLTNSFNEARDAVQKGIDAGKSQDEIAELQERFDNAKTALDNFNAAIPQIGFEDLRSILSETQSPAQVQALFQAIGQSGFSTFEELQNAGDDAVIGIIAGFEQFGGSLDATTQRINEINAQLEKLTQSRQVDIVLSVTSAVDSITQGIIDKIGTGGVEVVTTPGTTNSGGTTTTTAGGTTTTPRPAAKPKTPKVGTLVRSATNPGRGYKYVSSGLYRYVG